MIPDDLAQWGDDFEVFHARFARFFERSEPRQQAVKYMRGLMSPVQRKNGWQLAEAVGDETPDKMQRLLSELLELSRIGRMMNPPQAVPFEAIVREAIELLYNQIETRGVTIEIAPDLPSVYGDRTRLVEVVQNLMDNAIKFMGAQPQPRVEIGVQGIDEKNRPIFFVRDNGIGIEPHFHDKIFGLFNKLDPISEGTGVGLAVVKRIIEVHEGRVWVESQLGEGTTFHFTLPTGKQES